MEFRIWELGIVMIGIGFLIVCIYLSFTIKSVDNTVKKVELLVDDNIREIGQIIGSVAGITTSIDTIVGGATKIVGLVSGAKIISSIGKNKDSRRD